MDTPSDLEVLVYLSAATRDLSTPELRDLLQRSRKRNLWRGVTGLLAQHRRMYLHVMEGPRSVVGALFQQVSADERHVVLGVLLQEPLSGRRFPTTAMGYRDLVHEPLPASHNEFCEDGLLPERFLGQADRTRQFLHALADTRLPAPHVSTEYDAWPRVDRV